MVTKKKVVKNKSKKVKATKKIVKRKKVKLVSKKTKAVKTKVKNLVKKVENEDFDFEIDWKISIAFISGIILTLIICFMMKADFSSIGLWKASNNSNVESSNLVLKVLTSKDCSFCVNEAIIASLEQFFNGMKTEYVYVDSEEGKALINELEVTSIPLYYFDNENDFNSQENASYFKTQGFVSLSKGDYLLNVPSVIDVNYNAPNSTPSLTLYVMSKCPYGVPAEKVSIEATQILPDMELNLEYIGNVYASQTEINESVNESVQAVLSQYDEICAQGMGAKYKLGCNDTERSEQEELMWNSYSANVLRGCVQKNNSKYYCSLHGESEVDRDIIQLCAVNLTENWKEFILSFINNNFDVNKASQAAGINASEINACLNSEKGLDLFEQSVNKANDAKVSASPTYMYYGTEKFSVNNPAEFFCYVNPELTGCDKVDSLSVSQAKGSC